MNTIARAIKDTSGQDEIMALFFANLHSNQSFDWPEEWGSPYAFKWANDVNRDQVVNWLCPTEDDKTDLPVAQVLRWLLFLFRAARYRKVRLGDWFDQQRWRWVTNEEAMQQTGLTLKQLRRAVAILEERGLVRVVRDYKLNSVPHYRPSADLFRLCRYVTQYTDEEVLEKYSLSMGAGSRYGVAASDIRAADARLRKGSSVIYTQHCEEVQQLVMAFARSTDADRFVTLRDGWDQVAARAFDAD